ncbi:MAG: helix-turn-helix domain-containing protein [Bacillota bacterium]
MKKVGEILCTTRTEKGLTFNQVEEATKIRSKYLEAIEKGLPDEIPGRVYALGFLRSYAGFLGLDARGLVLQFNEEYPAQEDDRPEDKTNTSLSILPFRHLSRWFSVIVGQFL